MKSRPITHTQPRTHEGGAMHAHSLDHALEFFSKAGSLFVRKTPTFYDSEETALSLFQKAFIVDEYLGMKLLFWLRDCRGGAGNRSGFRECLHWLSTTYPEWVYSNIAFVPELGRWDDLRAVIGTKVEESAMSMWAAAIKHEKNVLAAKWADRKDKGLQKALGLNEAGLRKMLAALRKQHIVEHKMCQGAWKEIEYHTVPSLAAARYAKAFRNHDPEGYEKFMEDVASGKVEIKADVLFPHDCVRTVLAGQYETADAQFDALPNYMEDTNERVIVIADTSGSMSQTIAGAIEAIHVSQAMALYCSAKIPEDNPFHKKFIQFCSESKLTDWNGMRFSDAVRSHEIFDRAIGSTRIDKALMGILKVAKYFNLTQEQMPTTLIIVSDMQFHQGVAGPGDSGRYYSHSGSKGTEVDKCIDHWRAEGYEAPKIIYWNTAGYAGSPATLKTHNVGLVSGFSPSILKAIFAGDDLTPKGVMMRTLEKYTPNPPAKP